MKKFDEIKYNSLLEKLEAVEIPLSYVSLNNDVFRFDSNYFLKEFLQNENLIRRKKFDKLKNLSVDIKSFGAYSLNNEVEYLEKGIPFIRGVDMKNSTINFDNIIYISETANKLLWKSEIKLEMVLLSMSGTIGDVAIALKDWKYPINSSQDLVKIDTNWLINPYYLYCFLLTKFGKNYFKREARGSVQQHIFLSQIEQFKIPIFKDDFIEKIEYLIKQGHSKLEKSKSLYTQTEQTLLQTLDLSDWQPTEKNTAIKTFSASFGSSGRLDAEYYQPKYEQIKNRIKKYSYGFKLFSEIIRLKDENFEPDEKKEYRYIELADIGNTGEIISCMTDMGINLPSRARRLVNQNDIVISSIEGSLDKCALVSAKYDNALCSTGFYVANSELINSETLLLLFKTYPIQQLLKRRCSGTILTAISKDELQNIPIPLIPPSMQNKLANQIQSSFKLREASARLIETAKQAVEIAIEQNEKAAMEFIKANE